MTIGRVDQLVAEAAHNTAAPVQVVQLPVEALTGMAAPVQVDQAPVEAAFVPSIIPVVVDQIIVEAIYIDPPPVAVSQVVAEAAHNTAAPVQVDQVVVEVLTRDPAAALPDNIVFAVAPNWDDGITERLEYLSWSVRSHGGLGQRAALRWVPRLAVEYAVLAGATEAALLDLLIAAGQSATYILPRWQHGQALGATLAAGSSSITIDTTDREFVAGGYALIRTAPRVYEQVQVLAVYASYITLAAPTVAEWPAAARIFPAARAILADSQPVSRVTAGVVTARLAFQFLDLPAPASWLPDESLAGVPVWLRSPDGGEARDVTYTRAQNRIDYGFTEPHVTDAPGRAFIRRGERHVMVNRADVSRFRGFFAGGHGKRRKFWKPVRELGITLAADALSADTALTIAAIGYSDFFAGLTGRLALAIRSTAGVWTFAQIQSIDGLSATTDSIVLTAALGVNMARADVAALFFLEMVTHDADVLELHWITDTLAETSIATIGVDQ